MHTTITDGAIQMMTSFTRINYAAYLCEIFRASNLFRGCMKGVLVLPAHKRGDHLPASFKMASSANEMINWLR